jgi:hypothetical protein
MGKEQHLRVATFQGFAIPSTPLDIAMLGMCKLATFIISYLPRL